MLLKTDISPLKIIITHMDSSNSFIIIMPKYVDHQHKIIPNRILMGSRILLEEFLNKVYNSNNSIHPHNRMINNLITKRFQQIHLKVLSNKILIRIHHNSNNSKLWPISLLYINNLIWINSNPLSLTYPLICNKITQILNNFILQWVAILNLNNFKLIIPGLAFQVS
jgi:hypothetical protein